VVDETLCIANYHGHLFIAYVQLLLLLLKSFFSRHNLGARVLKQFTWRIRVIASVCYHHHTRQTCIITTLKLNSNSFQCNQAFVEIGQIFH
jgi:hypothetical protein